MDNPRAIYSRGIWQGGGATVLKSPDYSNIFDKVIRAQVAKDKAIADKKNADKKVLLDAIKITGDYDIAKEEAVTEEVQRFYDEADQIAQGVGYDFNSSADGMKALSKINSLKLRAENFLYNTKENKKEFYKLQEDVTDNTHKGKYYDDQAKEIQAKLSTIKDIKDPKEEALALYDFKTNTDFQPKENPSKLYADLAQRFVKSNTKAGTYMGSDGILRSTSTNEVVQVDVDELNKVAASDQTLIPALRKEYKYEASKLKDANGNPLYADEGAYIKQKLTDYGNTLPYKKQASGGYMPSGSGAGEAKQTMQELIPQYTQKTHNLTGEGTESVNVYGSDWTKYNKGGAGFGANKLENVVVGERSIDINKQSNIDPNKQYYVVYSGVEVLPVIREDYGSFKKGFITEEQAKQIQSENPEKYKKIVGTAPIIRRYIVEKNTFDQQVKGADYKDASGNIVPSKLETFIRDTGTETYYPYTQGRDNQLDQDLIEMTLNGKKYKPSDYVKKIWGDYHRSLGLDATTQTAKTSGSNPSGSKPR